MQTIADRWQRFEEVVIPADVGLDQRKEMRRVFYAGAFAVQTLGTGLPENELRDTIDRLHEDLRAFKSDVRDGRA